VLTALVLIACGVSGSGAPAGICDASEVLKEKEASFRDRIGVSYGFASSVLFFDSGLGAPTERHTVMASYEHPMKGRWTLEAAAGSLLGGHVGGSQFSPGVQAAVSLSHLVAPPRGRYVSPFVLLSFTLAGVWARAGTDYVAFDFDASLAAGMSIEHVTPFVVGRLYGGPVFWKGSLGSDAYHYAVGPGLAVSLAHSRIGLSIGGSVFGEKSIKGGATVAF
jgi:hypothetical protein